MILIDSNERRLSWNRSLKNVCALKKNQQEKKKEESSSEEESSSDEEEETKKEPVKKAEEKKVLHDINCKSIKYY